MTEPRLSGGDTELCGPTGGSWWHCQVCRALGLRDSTVQKWLSPPGAPAAVLNPSQSHVCTKCLLLIHAGGLSSSVFGICSPQLAASLRYSGGSSGEERACAQGRELVVLAVLTSC